MQIVFNQKKMNVNVLFSAEQICARVKELGTVINRDYGADESLVILVVLNGAFIFAADLVRHLEMPTEIESVRIKSYEGMKSVGEVSLLTPLPRSLVGKHVLIVEDIVDTGHSVHFLQQEIAKMEVASLKVCSLLDKPASHEFEVSVDYCGFSIGKNFVIGYGLDLDGKYRNLPFVADLLPA
jgi:hypoxanthine phosphoribosyltransferase